jgi:hypothetical protein
VSRAFEQRREVPLGGSRRLTMSSRRAPRACLRAFWRRPVGNPGSIEDGSYRPELPASLAFTGGPAARPLRVRAGGVACSRGARCRSIDRRDDAYSAFGDASRGTRSSVELDASPRVLLGVASPSTSPSGVHSRAPKCPSAGRSHPSCSFRPRGFSPPRRLPPPDGSQACCIPQPTMRFVAFSRPGTACPPCLRRVFATHSPPERFPAPTAVRTSPCADAPSSLRTVRP